MIYLVDSFPIQLATLILVLIGAIGIVSILVEPELAECHKDNLTE